MYVEYFDIFDICISIMLAYANIIPVALKQGVLQLTTRK